MKDFSTLAPNVVLVAGSDDYIEGIATPMVQMKYKGNAVFEKIILGKHCIVGSGSVVLPNVELQERACLGALALAKNNLKEYTLNAGIPSVYVKNRDKLKINLLEKEYKNEK